MDLLIVFALWEKVKERTIKFGSEEFILRIWDILKERNCKASGFYILVAVSLAI